MICTIDDIREVRSISYAIRDMAKIEPFIEEAELLDVMPVISPPLYRILEGIDPMPQGQIYIQVKDGRIVADTDVNLVAVNDRFPFYNKYFLRDQAHRQIMNEQGDNISIQGDKGILPPQYTYLKGDGKYVKDNNDYIILDEEEQKPVTANLYEDILYNHFYDNDRGFHNGLKRSIAYFAYARAITQANINMTAFGLVSKLSDNSQPVSVSAIKMAENEARQIAVVILQDVIKYIDWKYCREKDPELIREPKKEVKSITFYSIGD